MTEPVSTDLAKAHLGIEAGFTADDTLIDAYIAAARQFVEDRTGRVLVSASFTEVRAAFGDYITLYRQPVTALTSIAYTDASGADVPYEGAIERLTAIPPRLYPPAGSTFPELGANGLVTIEYEAGYGAGEVPAPLIQAILLLVGHWYQNRSTVEIGTGSAMEVPFAVTMLLEAWKVPVL
jgi:uncharacterized phiE125 gp8 family phage protein